MSPYRNQLPYDSPYSNHSAIHLPKWILDDFLNTKSKINDLRKYKWLTILDYIAKTQRSDHKSLDYAKNENGYIKLNQEFISNLLSIPQPKVSLKLKEWIGRGYLSKDQIGYTPGIESSAYKVIGNNEFVLARSKSIGKELYRVNVGPLGREIYNNGLMLRFSKTSLSNQLKNQLNEMHNLAIKYSNKGYTINPFIVYPSFSDLNLDSEDSWIDLLNYGSFVSSLGIYDFHNVKDLGKQMYYIIRSLYDYYFLGHFWASESYKNGRFYSITINLHRPYRKLLYHDLYGDIQSPDLANSQAVSLLVYMISNKFSPSNDFAQSILEGSHYDNCIYKLDFSGSRDEFKVGYFKELLFAKVHAMKNKHGKIAKYFSELYPKEYKWIWKQKLKEGMLFYKDWNKAYTFGHKIFNWKLTQIESDWMIKKVIPSLYEKGIWAYPVHDGLMVIENDKETGARIMKECFKDLYGLTPTVR